VAIKKHLFISTGGTLLPQWKLAFGKAIGISNEQANALPQADLLWLRLQPGIPVTRQIETLHSTAHNPTAMVIVMSDQPDDDEALAAFSATARGYVNSHAGAETLKQVARVVTDGGLWIGESLMKRLMLGVQKLPQPVSGNSAAPRPKLTDRELEVARAIAAGASNKEVARQLNITERTVKAHVSGLFAKLAVQDRLQLALKIRDMF
jgi:two-component system nitrate/nitrite response regulator NarL